MGLDQYVLKLQFKKGANKLKFEKLKVLESLDELKKYLVADFDSDDFYYWRKHYPLQDWFLHYFFKHSNTKEPFNGNKFVIITKELLDTLKEAIVARELDYMYESDSLAEDTALREREYDLTFIEKAYQFLKENNDAVLVYMSTW